MNTSGNTKSHNNTSIALIVDPSFPPEWQKGWEKIQLQDSFRAPIVTRNAPEALRYLSSNEIQFGSIYLNAVLTAPGVLRLIRMSHQIHTGTPIYILYDGSEGSTCPFSPQELNRLATQAAVERKTEAEFFNQLTRPTINLAQLPQEELVPHNAVESFEPEDYVSIPIGRFNFSSKIFFDVYIRVSDKKFLKIHSAGNALPEAQLRNYLKKGVTHLYIPRSSHLRCLEYCNLLERTFLTSAGLSPAVKIATTLNRGHSALEVLRNQRKFDEQQAEEILEFTNDVRRLLSQLSLDKTEDVQAIMQNVSIYEHSVGAMVIALMLAKPLNLEHEQSAEILGIASFLHDIGLSRMPPAVQSEDPSQMIGNQKELYHQHPTMGAQLLRESGSVHPVVLQVVAQHHERRGGSGFPNQLVGQQIHRLSEIVGFSDELVHLIQSRPGVPIKSVLEEMEKSAYELFSLQVMEAFQKAFAPLRK